MSRPVMCRWDGDAFQPLPHMHNILSEYVIGEVYRLSEVEDRSHKTHNHYFACIHEAWLNLPERDAVNFPTAEHLRKWCLIRCGYSDERTIVCSSQAEARRLAAFIKPMDEFAVVIVREVVVRVLTAQSQSKRAMGAKVFQQSKTAVLDMLEAWVGSGLQAAAGGHA